MKTAGYYPYAPPHKSFSEIIGVSRISPQSWSDELTSTWLGTCKMVSELFIWNNFNEETHQPYDGTNVVSHHKFNFLSCWVNIDEVNWTSINNREDALHCVYEAKCFGKVDTGASLFPIFTHLFVSIVLSSMSDKDVDGKAEAPHRNKSLCKEHSNVNVLTILHSYHPHGEVGQHERYGPHDVNPTVVSFSKGLNPDSKKPVATK